MYDVNRGTPFKLAVRFKRQAVAPPVLAPPAAQAKDIAVLSAAYGADADLALATDGAPPAGISVATSVTGAAGEDVTVTYTFGRTARPDVYSITVKCDVVTATDGSPSLTTGDGCSKVYTFRVASTTPAVVSATLVIAGLTEADIKSSEVALKAAFKEGIAKLVKASPDKVTIKLIYIVKARLLSLAGRVSRALAPGDVAVDFEVATTLGADSTELKDTLGKALGSDTTAAAPFTSAVTAMLTSVATAAGKAPSALTATVTAVVSVAVAIAPPPSAVKEESAGTPSSVIGGAAAAAGIVVLVLAVYLWKKGLLCGASASAKVAPHGASAHGMATAKVAPAPHGPASSVSSV